MTSERKREKEAKEAKEGKSNDATKDMAAHENMGTTSDRDQSYEEAATTPMFRVSGSLKMDHVYLKGG